MLVNDNRLRFRVGGVTGPGTYGPYLAQQWLTEAEEVVVMPELEWKVPPAFAYLYTPASETLGACSFLQQSGCYGFPCDGTYVRTVPDESQCTFTVGEDEISLNCTDIVSHLPNLPPYFERGDFDMTSSCRIVYQ